MNTTFLNILSAIMYIAEKNGEEIIFNAENSKLYKVVDKSSGVFTLLPLDGSEPPTSLFSEAALITRNDIANRSAKIGRIMAKNGITTGKQRENNGTETEYLTAPEQDADGYETESRRPDNGKPTANQRLTIGTGTVSLPRISQLYTGELAAVLSDIEAALDRVFLNTSKETTIKKYIEKYDNIKRLAAAGQLYELKLVLKSLQGTVEKQKAMQKGAAKYEFKQTLKKRLINSFIIIVFAAAALLYFRPWKRPTPTPPVTATVLPGSAVPGADGGQLVEAAILEFEATTGKKIYPAGRACLQKTAARLGLKTKNEIVELINNNVK